MGSWDVNSKERPGILMLRLEGQLSVEEMQEFLRAHNAAVDSYQGATYRVFCDIRKLMPLSPPAAALMERAKAYSASQSTFMGSAVLTAGSLVAMQHRRTSVTGGVSDTELISEDENACWQHLREVSRNRQFSAKGPTTRRFNIVRG